MQKEIIKKTIENVLKELESIDYIAKTRQIFLSNNKKVHNAYDILFDLKQKLEED